MERIPKDLIRENEKKIVFLIMDGLGGLPMEPGGRTELESARTPRMDALAAESECGLHQPIGYGITPGSAPGHLAIFGYAPQEYPIGRGVVAAMGIGFPIRSKDVAARLNFASLDEEGRISDRRAGRIPTEKCAELCDALKGISISGVEVFVRPVKDYRAVAVFRGEGLSDQVADTDPQVTGVPPLAPEATSAGGKRTAEVAAEFIRQACAILKNRRPANGVLMRGFAELPVIPSMGELFGLKPLALAVYPDYKGVARLVGMGVIEDLADLGSQMKALQEHWAAHDFFFVHHKYTDSRGEDGDFAAKVKEIEKVDEIIPSILSLKPDVLVVTGDHSTPARLKSHSPHPVPFLVHAQAIRPDGTREFGERACARGLWGVIRSTKLMPIALGYAEKLLKFGA